MTEARTIAGAFDTYQTRVNTDPDDLAEARRRRDLFDEAYCSLRDVVDVFCSGSLARRTHIDPIHDVDTVVIFDPTMHPTWDDFGRDAHAALAYTADLAVHLLARPNAEFGYELAKAEIRHHSVRCTFRHKLRNVADAPDFTVDVTPALRQPDGSLRIPEHKPAKGISTWISTHPEYLIDLVAAKQANWNLYVPGVRDLKDWRRTVDTKVKSLVMEILALDCLHPGARMPEALAGFFVSATTRVWMPIEDPARLCGPIQADLDVEVLHGALTRAAKLAAQALEEEHAGRIDDALRTWRKVLGSKFPAPFAAPALVGAPAAAVAAPRRVPDNGLG